MNANDDLLTNLKIISSLQKGQKLDVSDKTVHTITSSYDEYVTAIVRFRKVENRDKTVEFIRTNIDQAISLINILKQDLKIVASMPTTEELKKLKNIKRLIEAVKASFMGVENVKETYKTDVKITSFLDTLLTTRRDAVEIIENELHQKNVNYDDISISSSSTSTASSMIRTLADPNLYSNDTYKPTNVSSPPQPSSLSPPPQLSQPQPSFVEKKPEYTTSLPLKTQLKFDKDLPVSLYENSSDADV